MLQPNFKIKTFRCKKILQMAKGEACTHCGKNDGTTVAAHMDGLKSGRGMGLKAHDYLVAYLCDRCHYDFDHKRGQFQTVGLAELNFTNAMAKTMAIWVPRLIAPDWSETKTEDTLHVKCPHCFRLNDFGNAALSVYESKQDFIFSRYCYYCGRIFTQANTSESDHTIDGTHNSTWRG